MRRFDTPYLADWLATTLRWVVLVGLLTALSLRGELGSLPFGLLLVMLGWNILNSILAIMNLRLKRNHRQIVLAVDFLLAEPWSDPGASFTDDCSGLHSVVTNSAVNPNQVGVYTVTYVATDGAGNAATNSRTVYVRDSQPPVLTLIGADPLQVECHQGFVDPGATATDLCAGALPDTASGTVDVNRPGNLRAELFGF